MRFFVVASNEAHGLEDLLNKVYRKYTDYVLKNPFYDLDMPIRCLLFDKEVDKIFQFEQFGTGTPYGKSLYSLGKTTQTRIISL